jgi:hypothetical protein
VEYMPNGKASPAGGEPSVEELIGRFEEDEYEVSKEVSLAILRDRREMWKNTFALARIDYRVAKATKNDEMIRRAEADIRGAVIALDEIEAIQKDVREGRKSLSSAVAETEVDETMVVDMDAPKSVSDLKSVSDMKKRGQKKRAGARK